MRTYIDFGNHEQKARDLYEYLVKDPTRQAQLFFFELETITWWEVVYNTRGEKA